MPAQTSYRERTAWIAALRTRPLWTSAVGVAALALCAKVVGATKELLVAERYGASLVVDQFVFVTTLAAWPAALATSILTTSLLPLLARPGVLKRAQADGSIRRLHRALLAAAVLVAGLFVLILPVCLPMGETAPTVFAWALVALLVLNVSASVAGLLLQAAGRQIGVLLESLPAATLAAALLLFASGSPVWLLPVGAAVGAMVHATVLHGSWRHAAPRLGTLGPALSETVAERPSTSSSWAKARQSIGLAALAYAVMSITPSLELALAGHLGEGSASSLGYAMRVSALASGLVAVAVNRVVLLQFCRDDAGRSAWRAPLVGFAATALAVSALVAAWAPTLIATLFERGAFDAATSVRVAELTRWQIASLPPYVASMVLCAALVARGRLRSLLEASVVCALVRICMALAGAHLDSLALIAAASSIGYAAMCCWLMFRVLHDDQRHPPEAPPTGRDAFDALANATRPAPLSS